MAFGEEAISTQRNGGLGYGVPPVRQDYTGYEKEAESGLEFAQARFQNPIHGRFTSVDPLTASATIRNPQSFNRYTYALNSPYKFTDPLGLLSEYTSGACGSRCKNSYTGENSGPMTSGGHDAAFDSLLNPPDPPESHSHDAEASPATQVTRGSTTVRTRIVGYPVKGDTLAEAIDNAIQAGIEGATPSGWPAETVPVDVHDIVPTDVNIVSTTFDEKTGIYTVTLGIKDTMNVTLNVNVILPTWPPGYFDDEASQREHGEFIGRTNKLMTHEFEHVKDIEKRADQYRNGLLLIKAVGNGRTIDAAQNSAIHSLIEQRTKLLNKMYTNIYKDGAKRDAKGHTY
ncbi:MAG TPA: RHS repeat-associated core domain-containing protein [Pyrinomonadaceae bacterium]|nr:RHS repeat-associated core domain-containing protein [Pyrinomonadaceae bacterium]